MSFTFLLNLEGAVSPQLRSEGQIVREPCSNPTAVTRIATAINNGGEDTSRESPVN